MKLACRLAIGLLLVTAMACLGAEGSGDPPLAMFSADHSRVFKRGDLRTEAFLAGAVKGIVYYNTLMLMEGSPPLFCTPTGGLGLDEFWNLASAVLKGNHAQDTIVVTALNGLRSKYPCSSSELPR